jgi:hypothetical protein
MLGLSAQYLACVVTSDMSFVARHILKYAALLIKIFIVPRIHNHCFYDVKRVLKYFNYAFICYKICDLECSVL